MYRLTGLYILCFLVCSPLFAEAVSNREEIGVFVSILPQKYLVERIGGNRVKVSVMVKPGHSPATYEPTPKQMAELHEARLYFRIGVPFESVWIQRIGNLNPQLGIIECCGVLNEPGLADHNHAGSGNHDAMDPHVWTSPKNAIVLAGIIKSALTEYDPSSGEYYAVNYNMLVNDLDSLDAFIRRELAGIKNPYFIVSHPAWGHYAAEYGLQQISIEQHGTEVRARELTRLVEFARKRDIHTVYVQKEFNTASARTLAREINGKIVELDPLAEDYINNLRYVTRAIAEGGGRE